MSEVGEANVDEKRNERREQRAKTVFWVGVTDHRQHKFLHQTNLQDDDEADSSTQV